MPIKTHILIRGDAYTPPRFWDRVYVTEQEAAEKLKGKDDSWFCRKMTDEEYKTANQSREKQNVY